MEEGKRGKGSKRRSQTKCLKEREKRELATWRQSYRKKCFRIFYWANDAWSFPRSRAGIPSVSLLCGHYFVLQATTILDSFPSRSLSFRAAGAQNAPDLMMNRATSCRFTFCAVEIVHVLLKIMERMYWAPSRLAYARVSSNLALSCACIRPVLRL